MLFIECAICFTVYVVNTSLESSWMVRAQIDLNHVIVTVDFITVILSLNDHLKYRNFITQKTLTIIIVHLHSNIDSLVQRNCLVLYFDKEKKYLYFIILYILLLSRASSAMRETSIPGRERLSRNSVEKVQLLLLFCD